MSEQDKPENKPVTYNGISYPYTVSHDGKILNSLGQGCSQTLSNGYYTIRLSNGSKSIAATVSRVVAEAFVSKNDPSKNIVDHIDSNKLNNHYKNLRWVTQAENVRYAVEAGKNKSRTVACACYTLNWEYVTTYPTLKAAYDAIGADRAAIRRVHRGENNHCKGFKWIIIDNIDEEKVTNDALLEMRSLKVIDEKWAEYFVSKEGRVVSTKGRRDRWRYMKIKIDDNGYEIVQFSAGSQTKNYRVHVLVITCFIGPSDGIKTQVNHKNKIRSDNRVENLEWVTASENMIHASNFEDDTSLLS